MSSSSDAIVFEDADRLKDWLSSREQTPYIDFEILTVTLSDGALEVDPMGNADRLEPLLRQFAQMHGYVVNPFDPESGTISLLRERFRNN